MASKIITILEGEWEEFKEKFNKIYAGEEEEKQHREQYLENKKKIHAHNEKFKAGEVTFEMGINQFADLNDEERKKYHGVRK